MYSEKCSDVTSDQVMDRLDLFDICHQNEATAHPPNNWMLRKTIRIIID